MFHTPYDADNDHDAHDGSTLPGGGAVSTPTVVLSAAWASLALTYGPTVLSAIAHEGGTPDSFA